MHNSQIIKRRNCPICGSSNIKDYYSDYKRCSYCGSAFVNKIVKQDGIYDDKYYFFDDTRKKENLKRADYQLQHVKKILNKNNADLKRIKLLDIGCGTGEFVFKCLESGLDAYGVDFSGKAVDTAVARYSINNKVSTVSIEDMPDSSYSVITLWEVVEHFESPLEIIRQTLRLLEIGGILILSTPNVGSFWVKLLKSKWHGFGIPEYHITYFCPTAMKIALEERLSIEQYEINTVSPYNNYLFLTKNVLGSIVPNIKNNLLRKLIKGIYMPVVFIPNKLLEYVVPHVMMGDTLIVHAIKNKSECT